MPKTRYQDIHPDLNAHLYTKKGFVLSVPFGEVVRGPLYINGEYEHFVQNKWGYTDEIRNPHVLRYPLLQSTHSSVSSIFRKTPVLDVNYRWSTEYFHFLTEVLPDILYLNSKYPNRVIYCETSTFAVPVLKWFGLYNDIIPDVSKQLVDRIQVPYNECGTISPQRLAILREKVRQKLVFEKTHGVFIHRRRRKLLNEAEVFESYKSKYPHLTWVLFDEMSIADTAALFSRAAVIVGPHGAGHTNMIFSDTGIEVIEFMQYEHPNLCYWHISQLLGNVHTIIPCKIEDAEWNITLRPIPIQPHPSCPS